MKILLAFVLASLTCTTHPAAACERGDFKILQQRWKSFREVSLSDQPERAVGFYKFPLMLLSPFDGDKPFLLSKRFIERNYRLVFREIVPGEKVHLFVALKKTRGDEYIPSRDFGPDGCALPGTKAVRIEDYYFAWDKKQGWLIESLYYSDDILLKSVLGK